MRQREINDALIASPLFDRELLKTYEVKSLDTVLQIGEVPETALRANTNFSRGVMVFTNRRLLFLNKTLRSLKIEEFGWPDLIYIDDVDMGLLPLTFINNKLIFIDISKSQANTLETYLISKFVADSIQSIQFGKSLISLPNFDRRLILTGEVKSLSTVLNDDETPELVLRANFRFRDGIVVATDERFLFLHHRSDKTLETDEFGYGNIASVRSKSDKLELRFVLTDSPAKFSGIAKDLIPRAIEFVNEKISRHRQKLYDTIEVLPDFDQELLLTPEIILLPTVLQEGETPEKVVRASRGNTEGVLVATDSRLLFLFVGSNELHYQEFQWSKLRSVKHSGSSALTLFFFDVEARQFEEVEFVGISETLIDRLETHLTSKKMPVADQRIQKLYDTIAVLPDFDQELLLTPEIILLPTMLQEDETPEKVVRASRESTQGVLIATDRRLVFSFYSEKRHWYNEFQWSNLRSVNPSGSGTLTLLFIIDEEARQHEEVEFIGISETLVDRLETHMTSKMPAAIQKLYDTIAVLPDFDQELLLTPEIILLPTVLQEDETPEKIVRASIESTEGVLISTDRRLLFLFMFGKIKELDYREFQWSKLRSVNPSGSGTLTLLFIIDEEARQFDEIEFLGISETLINRLETHLTSKITRESAHKHKRVNELLDALPPDFDRRLLLTSEVRLLSLVLNDDETPELVLRAKFMSRDGIVVVTDERFMFIHYSGKELEVIVSTYWDIVSAKSKNKELEMHFVSADTPANLSGIAKDLIPIVVEVVNEKIFQHQQELYDTTAVLPGFDRELLRAILQQHEVLEKVVRASIESTDGILVATDHRLLFLFGSRKALQKHEFQWTKLRSVKRSGSGALTLLFIDEEAKHLTEIEFIGIAEAPVNTLETHLISKVPTEHQSINEMLEDETPEKVVGASRGNTDGLLVATNRHLFFLFDISDSVHSYKWHWTQLMSVNRSGSGALTLLFGSEEIRFDKISETLIDEFETFLISKIRRQSFTEESRTKSTSSVIEEARYPVRSNSYSFTGIAVIAIASAFIVNYLFFNRSYDGISKKSDVLEYEGELLDYEISYVSDLVSEDVDVLEYEGDSRDNEWNYAEDRESDDEGDAWDYEDREWGHEDENKERDYEENEYREREW